MSYQAIILERKDLTLEDVSCLDRYKVNLKDMEYILLLENSSEILEWELYCSGGGVGSAGCEPKNFIFWKMLGSVQMWHEVDFRGKQYALGISYKKL